MLNIHRRGDEELPTESAVQEEKPSDARKRSEKSVMVYVVTLFAVVLLLLFLSYFIQQRRNSATITDITEQHSAFSTQALQDIEELQNKNLQLTEDLSTAEDKADTLEKELSSVRAELQAEKDSAESAKEDGRKKLVALENLALAMLADKADDEESAKAALSVIEKEHLKEYLDGHWAEDYENLHEKLG